jgi:hypothetical protein
VVRVSVRVVEEYYVMSRLGIISGFILSLGRTKTVYPVDRKRRTDRHTETTTKMSALARARPLLKSQINMVKTRQIIIRGINCETD